MSINQETLGHIQELKGILKRIFENNPQTWSNRNYKDQASFEKDILKRIQGQNFMILRKLSKKMIIEYIQIQRAEFFKSLDGINYEDQTNYHYDVQTNQGPFHVPSLEQSHLNLGNNPPPMKKEPRSRSRKLSHQVSHTKTKVRPENIQVKDRNFKTDSDQNIRRSESMDSPRIEKRHRTQDNYQQQDQVRSQKKCKKQQTHGFSNTIKIKQVQKDNGLRKENQRTGFNQETRLEQNKENRQNNIPENNITQNTIQEKTQDINEVGLENLPQNLPFTVHEDQDEIESPVFPTNIQRNVHIASAFQGDVSELPDNQPTQEARMNEQIQTIIDEPLIPETLSQAPPIIRTQEEQNPQNQNENPFFLNQPYQYLETQEDRHKQVLRIKLKAQLRDCKYQYKRNSSKSLPKITNFGSTFQVQPQNISPEQKLKTQKFSIGDLYVKLSIDSNQRLIPQSIEFIINRNGLKFQTTDKLRKLTKDLKDVTGMKPAARNYRYQQLYRQFRLI